MRKSIKGILIFVLFLVLYCSSAFAMPPHPELLKKYQTGEKIAPDFIVNPQILKTMDIDQPPQRIAGVNKGLSKTLAILVDFSDKNSQVEGTFYDTLLFSSGGNSVRDYYSEVSYGTFTIITLNQPSSIGWIRAPQPYSYYTNGHHGIGGYPNDTRKLVEDTVDAVDSFIDFSQYDNDGDGYVDNLIIVHAGQGAEYSGSSWDIWSHQSHINDRIKDGVKIREYAVVPEYNAAPGDGTIGVFVHELGHVFGLPDLYSLYSKGAGYWSLMSQGAWNGNGAVPAHLDAWSKIKLGFITPAVIFENTANVSIRSVEAVPEVYYLWYCGMENHEYFLVENRQKTGYDAQLPAAGLLIWHIDENMSGNYDICLDHQNCNCQEHLLVKLEQADGLFEVERLGFNYGNGGDPYPGSAVNRNFNNISTPNSGTYYDCGSFIGVNNISDSGPLMSADIEVCGTCNTLYYRDADGDGYGNPADIATGCVPPTGYVPNNTDCNDSNSALHPGATEVCEGLDNDCDGLIDDNALPQAPYNLSASATSATSVGLSWSYNPLCQDGFKIERKLTINGTYGEIANLPADARNYSDNNINEGGLYYYRVRAVNDGSYYSNYSNTAAVNVNGQFTCNSPNVCSNCAYTSIQSAISAGVNNICVGNGVYTDSLTIPANSALNILSQNGKEYTTISGGFINRPVKISSGANVIIDGFTIKDSNSKALDSGGGAIYMLGNAKLNLKNCNFINNTNTTAKSGGAIYANTGCNLSVQNCSFTNNRSAGSGGVLYAKGSVCSFTDSTIASNSGTTTGGAIFADAATQLTVQNCTFARNKAAGSGGAIYAKGAAVSVTGSGMNENTTTGGTGYGAVFYLYSGATLSLTNSSFSNNNCISQSGGVIYGNGSRVANIQNCVFNGNMSKLAAGVWYEILSTGDTSITSSTFTNNHTTYTTSGSGGAIYYKGAKKAVFENCSFNGNYAKQYGGAVYSPVANNSFEFINCDFSNNYAQTADGGALYILGGATTILDIQDSTFTSCKARSGGAIYLKTGKLNMINSNFYLNKSLLPASGDGGTLYISSTTSSYIEGCNITGSNARYGGAIYLTSNVGLEMFMCILESNSAGAAGSAVGLGGAVCVSNTSATKTAKIRNCTFMNNTATNSGGAIYAKMGKLEITFSGFESNSVTNPALYNGGAVSLVSNSGSLIEDCMIWGSNARYGGGLYGSLNTNLNINRVQFYNNLAGVQGSNTGIGGAVYFNAGTNNVTECSFIENSATANAAGIYETGGTLTLKNSDFENNILTNPSNCDGGTLYLKTTSNSLIDRCVISGSAARNGGGFHSLSNTNLKMTNSVFKENSAALGGGAVTFCTGSNTVINCTFAYNSSPGMTGAAISNITNANTKIYNSILYFNNGSTQINDAATMALTDVLLQGSCAGCNTLTRVVDADPLFMGPEDYHISSQSPAKDSGSYVSGNYYLDIDDQTRPNGNWDIGADEYY